MNEHMQPILRKLEGGDRRSIGRSNEVVADVIANPDLFDAVFSGLQSNDPILRARSADALEKITLQHPEYLRPYRTALIGPLARLDQKEVRWHIAQMLPRIGWNRRERQQVLAVLTLYLDDSSSMVKTFAMQAFADLANEWPELEVDILRMLKKLTAAGTPAMKARGRRLLAWFGQVSGSSTERAKRRGAG